MKPNVLCKDEGFLAKTGVIKITGWRYKCKKVKDCYERNWNSYSHHCKI